MTQPDCHDDNHDTAITSISGSTDAAETCPEIGGSQQSNSEIDRLILAVRDAVGEQNYQHWFQRRARFQVAADRLIVHVPNPFILNWMLRRFRTPLNKAAQLILGPSGSCQLEVDESLIRDTVVTTSKSATVINSGITVTTDLTNKSAANIDHEAAGPVRFLRAVATPKDSGAPHLTGSRRRFRSFESFLQGDCNGLAVLAAKQVAVSPGQRYNPLFIFGGTGTGKTHLLEAIYTEFRRTQPSANGMYLTSEAFTNYFTSALSSKTVPSFRQRFRNVDLLLIDNIEFLDNKRATQEEFLHTIVQLIDQGGQVVISSDRHPRMLTRHREELTTRFLSGLVCRVESPDDVTRLKLARSLCTGLKAVFSDEALDYIVRRCRRNIRELQGALNQLDGHFSLNGRRITLPVAREVLGELSDECRRLVRISDVEKVVCDAFGVTAGDLRSPSRRKAIALPRAIAMFLARKLTRSAYREIGLYFGGRDHSTVVAAERRVADLVLSGEVVGVPTSCSGQTMAELIDLLEHQLKTLAS